MTRRRDRWRHEFGANLASVEVLDRRVLLSAVDVLTYHNDNQRDGANLHETTLTPSNVNDTDFGKVGQLTVNGQVYAQPLYVSHVMMPNGVMHNVVYVATEGDSVYAFDAGEGGLLWQDNLTRPADGITTVPATDTGDPRPDLVPQVGITGTPVIDKSTDTMYFVANFKQVQHGTTRYFWRLFAVNIVTGAISGNILIQASEPGTGAGNIDGTISVSGLHNLQRTALTLNNGNVYFGFSSHGDIGKYHGWVIGYNATTLVQDFVWADTPNGQRGGIWMAGDGVAVDDEGNMYFATGDGVFDANDGGVDYGDSLLKFPPGATTPSDSFTPKDEETLYVDDLDLGSGGVIVLPTQKHTTTPNEAILAGKTGTIYVVNLDNMGGFNATTDQVVQEITGSAGLKGSWDVPAYFNNTIYYAGAFYNTSGPLEAYSLTNGLLSNGPTAEGSINYGWPAPTPSVSANGDTDGIVWMIGKDAQGKSELVAYNAANVSQKLYDSDSDPSRDQGGKYVKYSPPTIANGRVFVGEDSGVSIYGLL